MNPRFSFDKIDSSTDESAEQKELLRLLRIARSELAKRLPEIGCMNPDEIVEYLKAFDQLMDLHVSASLHDDRIASIREKMQRVWCDE